MIVLQVYCVAEGFRPEPRCQIYTTPGVRLRRQDILRRPTIAKPPEPILLRIVVREPEILPPGLLSNNCYMACTSRPDTVYTAALDASIIP